MKQIVEKLKKQEEFIAQEKGVFDLFALFLREDAPNKWDLLVAAEWIEQNKSDAIKYLAQKVQQTLTVDELLFLSRIVVIDENNPDLAVLNSSFPVEHSIAEIHNSNLFGLQINHAYLITSKQNKTDFASI